LYPTFDCSQLHRAFYSYDTFLNGGAMSTTWSTVQVEIQQKIVKVFSIDVAEEFGAESRAINRTHSNSPLVQKLQLLFTEEVEVEF